MINASIRWNIIVEKIYKKMSFYIYSYNKLIH